MNRSRTVPFLCVLFLSLTATASSRAGEHLPVTPEQREALGIVVGLPEVRALVPRPRLPGRITLPNSHLRLITAKSSAILVSPLVAVGDSVRAGQALARLESPDFVSLQRDYVEALSQLDLARVTAERERQLADEGIIAGRRAAESTTRLRGAESRLEERHQALALSGMDEQGILRLSETHHLDPTVVLRATFSGVVLEQYARAGERLEAGGLLYRLGDLEALMVEIHTPLDIAHALDRGTRFSLPDEDAIGQVVVVGSEIHSLDQGVLVRGRIENGAAGLRPGQFVRVQFETPRSEGTAFAVPTTSLVHIRRHAWLFLQVEGGFAPVPVEIVGGNGRESVVVGPLARDSRLAIRGSAALKALWLTRGGPGQ